MFKERGSFSKLKKKCLKMFLAFSYKMAYRGKTANFRKNI